MKKLTEKQQKFIDVLFEEAKGNPVEAIPIGMNQCLGSTPV